MHGFCHIEIPTTDAKRSKEFYSKIFGWKIIESTPEYLMFSTPGNDGGGFTTTSKPSSDGVVLYIEVADIERNLREVEDAGGKIVKGKTILQDESGNYALFTDPSGNIMGLWSNR
jgi:predicted enzyme related to lactoylglutathione lyase